MKKALAFISICLIGIVLVLKEGSIDRPSGMAKDGCLACHDAMKDPDPSHPVSAFGCAVCHLGNRYSLDRERAHFSMVQNPGDLRIVDKTCGKSGCHPDMADRVKKSVMATNSGMIRILQEQWLRPGGANGPDALVRGVHVSDLYKEPPLRTLPLTIIENCVEDAISGSQGGAEGEKWPDGEAGAAIVTFWMKRKRKTKKPE